MISFGLYTTNYTTIYYYDMYEPAGLAGVTCSLCLSLFLLFFFSSSSSIPPSPPSHYCRRPTCLPSKLLIHPLLSIVYIYLLFGCFCLKLTLSPVALQFIISTYSVPSSRHVCGSNQGRFSRCRLVDLSSRREGPYLRTQTHPSTQVISGRRCLEHQRLG